MTLPVNLRFKSNHRFKILHFSDIHWKDGSPHEAWLISAIERILDLEKPDLVVLNGDSVHSPTRVLEGLRRITAPMAARQIPWAPTLGNHDDEGDANRAEIAGFLESLPFSMMERGPEELGACGNYTLKILHCGSDRPAARLHFLDAGTYSPLKPRIGGYAWITRHQIHWFETSNCGSALPSLVFLHIPLPEFLSAWEKGARVGQKNETTCAPELNSGLFTALVESGGVIGVFAGHDHDNDFAAHHHGISLCYGRSLGLDTYGNLPRGARVIELCEDEADFESWIREESGTQNCRFTHSVLARSKDLSGLK
jgi:hypothetical protein